MLQEFLQKTSQKTPVSLLRAENAEPQDFLKGDILILASGTWNTGGTEGQLHPYMEELLRKRAKDVALAGKKCTAIALGDTRYRYTARAGEHLKNFITEHGGELFCEPLTVVNEPYGQEEKIREWGEILLRAIT